MFPPRRVTRQKAAQSNVDDEEPVAKRLNTLHIDSHASEHEQRSKKKRPTWISKESDPEVLNLRDFKYIWRTDKRDSDEDNDQVESERFPPSKWNPPFNWRPPNTGGTKGFYDILNLSEGWKKPVASYIRGFTIGISDYWLSMWKEWMCPGDMRMRGWERSFEWAGCSILDNIKMIWGISSSF